MGSRNRSQKALVALLVFAAVTVLALLTAGQSSLASTPDKSSDLRSLPGRHLYLVPANAKGDAAVELTGASVIARYDTFSLVSADGSANPALLEAGADLRDDMRSVGVADGEVDPAAAPTLDAAGRESLSIVQFVGPVKGAWLDRIQKTGATVVTYMAQNAYLVHAEADQSAAVSALAGDDAVRAVTPFTAADKTDPGVPGSGTVKVTVQTLAGPAGAAARRVLAEGKPLEGDAAYDATVTTSVAIDSDRIPSLAADPAVVDIEPWVAPQLLDERAAQIVAARLTGGATPTAPGYLAFLNQQGFQTTTQPFVVDITDEGIDKGVVPAPAGSHPDLFRNGNAASASRIAYAHEATAGGCRRP